MGAGLARQAQERFPNLPAELGNLLMRNGNETYLFHHEGIITFPTKNNWHQDSDLSLIDKSAEKLAWFIEQGKNNNKKIFIPRVGCGLGNLQWTDVKEVLDHHLTKHVESGIVVYVE
jgi:hypothetical protein